MATRSTFLIITAGNCGHCKSLKTPIPGGDGRSKLNMFLEALRPYGDVQHVDIATMTTPLPPSINPRIQSKLVRWYPTIICLPGGAPFTDNDVDNGVVFNSTKGPDGTVRFTQTYNLSSTGLSQWASELEKTRSWTASRASIDLLKMSQSDRRQYRFTRTKL